MYHLKRVRSWVVPDIGNRAVSEIVGYVLLFGMVVTVSGMIIVMGGGLVAEMSNDLESDRAEKSLQQFDSMVSTVALSPTEAKEAKLRTDGGSYRIREDTGQINITATNVTSGDTTVLHTTSFGTIVHQSGQHKVAYQGGGVWRNAGGGGQMISPPEFSYRDGTLTFPIINVTGQETIDNTVSITEGSSSTVFPDHSISGDVDGANPIRGHNLTVTIQSKYYRGWGEYFEQRTDTEPSFNHDENTVKAKLVPPPTPITADSAIINTGDLTIKSNSVVINGDVVLGGTLDDKHNEIDPGDLKESTISAGAIEPADSIIDSAEDRLGEKGKPSLSPPSRTITSGSYSVDNDGIFKKDLKFDTSDGDIELYVDGEVSKVKDVTITGENDVKIYVDGLFHQNGAPSWGEKEKVDQLTLYAHETDRIREFYGIVYTDETTVKGIGNSPGLVGALISTDDKIELGGNSKITYDPSLSETVVDEVTTPLATINYLHISERTVRVEN
jgi:hypothetical protein